MDPRIVEAAKDLRRECAEDYVGLWCLPSQILHYVKLPPGVERKALSLEIAQQLLSDPDIIVGQFHKLEFQPWNLSARNSYDRISREWDALGKEPGLGDICWFTENAFHLTNR